MEFSSVPGHVIQQFPIRLGVKIILFTIMDRQAFYIKAMTVHYIYIAQADLPLVTSSCTFGQTVQLNETVNESFNWKTLNN